MTDITRKVCSAGDKCLHPDGPDLPISEFPKDANKKDGYSTRCKPCKRASTQAWLAKNPDRPHTEPTDPRRCTAGENCLHPDGPLLPLSQFGRDKDKRDGYATRCKTCKQAKVNEWLANNQEYVKAEAKEYAKRRPESSKTRHKEWYKQYTANNRDKLKKKSSEQYFKNRDKRIAQILEYRRKNPEVQRAIKLRYRARKEALPDTFTSNDLQVCLDWWERRCAYCGNQRGLLPGFKLSADHFIAITAENCPGTVPTNMVPACQSCNSQKHNSDPLEWLTRRFGKKQADAILTRVQDYFEWIRSRES